MSRSCLGVDAVRFLPPLRHVGHGRVWRGAAEQPALTHRPALRDGARGTLRLGPHEAAVIGFGA